MVSKRTRALLAELEEELRAAREAQRAADERVRIAENKLKNKTDDQLIPFRQTQLIDVSDGGRSAFAQQWSRPRTSPLTGNQLTQFFMSSREEFNLVLRQYFIGRGHSTLAFGQSNVNQGYQDIDRGVREFINFFTSVYINVTEDRRGRQFVNVSTNSRIGLFIRQQYNYKPISRAKTNQGKNILSISVYRIPLEEFYDLFLAFCRNIDTDYEGQNIQAQSAEFELLFEGEEIFTNHLYFIPRPEELVEVAGGKHFKFEYSVTQVGEIEVFSRLFNPPFDNRTIGQNSCFWKCILYVMQLKFGWTIRHIKSLWEQFEVSKNDPVSVELALQVIDYLKNEYQTQFIIIDREYRNIQTGEEEVYDTCMMIEVVETEDLKAKKIIKFNKMLAKTLETGRLGNLKIPGWSRFQRSQFSYLRRDYTKEEAIRWSALCEYSQSLGYPLNLEARAFNFYQHVYELCSNACGLDEYKVKPISTVTLLFDQDHCSIVCARAPSTVCLHCEVPLTAKELFDKSTHVCQKSGSKRIKSKDLLFFDYETRVDEHNKSIPVAISFSYWSEKKLKSKVWFGLDVSDRFIDYLINLRHPTTIISHNGGQFDNLILHGRMMQLCPERVDNESLILGGGLKGFRFNGHQQHQFIDSIKHLSQSLPSLCDAFKIDEEACKIKEFQWRGQTLKSEALLLMRPDLGPQEYLDFLESEPELKANFEAYSRNDVRSLALIWRKYEKAVKEATQTNISPSDSLTAPALAFKVFNVGLLKHRSMLGRSQNLKINDNFVFMGAEIKFTGDEEEMKNTDLFYQDGRPVKRKLFKSVDKYYLSAERKIKLFEDDGSFSEELVEELGETEARQLHRLLKCTFVAQPEMTEVIAFDKDTFTSKTESKTESTVKKVFRKADSTIFIEQTVIGGISYFREIGEIKGNIVARDVTSLYPFVMNECRYPYGQPIPTDSFVSNKLGVYRCTEIVCNRKYIADVPRLNEEGVLDWRSMTQEERFLTSIDINRILEAGGSMEIHEGYYWQSSYNPFKKFVDTFFTCKQAQDNLPKEEQNVALRNTCKLFLNSLFGKFCRRKDNSTIKIGHTFANLDEETTIVAFDFSSGQIFSKSSTPVLNCPIQLGTFILAHSRHFMQTLFDEVGRDKIIVSETDSIYMRAEDAHPLDWRMEQTGLGWLTRDVVSSAGIKVVGKKAYSVLKVNGKEDKQVMKGVPKKEVTGQLYDDLLTQGWHMVRVTNWKRNLFKAKAEQGVFIAGSYKILFSEAFDGDRETVKLMLKKKESIIQEILGEEYDNSLQQLNKKDALIKAIRS